MSKNNNIDIILNKKELINLIKNYYLNKDEIKNCKVKIEAFNIKDKIKHLEVFKRNDELYYGTVFKTTITGKIANISGGYNKFSASYDLQGTKEIVIKAIKSEYNYQATAVNILAKYSETFNDGYDISISGASYSVDCNFLKKMKNK